MAAGPASTGGGWMRGPAVLGKGMGDSEQRSASGGVRRAGAALIALAMAGCSPAKLLDRLAVKDAASIRVARDLPFAPGPRGMLDIYAPRAKAPGARPVILFFYGGAWISGSRDTYGFVGRALAARGFIVVIPDYRLVPDHPFPAFIQDGAAAVRWVRLHIGAYGGDPDRIVLTGHSAGAYNAAMLALDPQWLGADKAAVRGLIGLAGPYDFLPLDDPAAVAAFGAWPRSEETQPVRFVTADSPPTLLLEGAKDERIDPHNARSLAAALRRAGVMVDHRIYPRPGHGTLVGAIARPLRWMAPVLDDMAAFATRVTAKGRAETVHPPAARPAMAD